MYFASAYFESQILNTFRNITAAGHRHLYIGLFQTNPGETGTSGTEIVYAGYERQLINFTSPEAAQNGNTVSISNESDLTFPNSETAAGNANFIGIFDSPTGGNMILYGDLAVPLVIGANTQPSILAGDIRYVAQGNFGAIFKEKYLNILRGHDLDGFVPHWALFISTTFPFNFTPTDRVGRNGLHGHPNSTVNIPTNSGAHGHPGSTVTINSDNITATFPGYRANEGFAVPGNMGTAHDHGVNSNSVVISINAPTASDPLRVTSVTSHSTSFVRSGAHDHPSKIFNINHGHPNSTVNIPTNSGTHGHPGSTVNVAQNGDHDHPLNMNQVTIPNHQHAMPHTHRVTINPHRHQLTPAITNVGGATSFTLRINGINRQTFNTTNTTISIAQWLTNNQGELNRNTLNQIEIIPNNPAFVRIVALMEGMLMVQREIIT